MARGKEAPDLVDHLLTALVSVPDASFVGYITRRQGAYEEGEEVLPENLMDGATNKFNALTLAKKWMVRSPEETRMVILEEKLKTIDWGSSERPRKDNGATKRTKGDKQKRKRTKFVPYRKMPEWFRNKEKPRNPNETQQFNDCTWHWCGDSTKGKCEAWRLHKGSECNKEKHQKPNASNETNAPAKKKVGFNKTIDARFKALEAKCNKADNANSDSDEDDTFDFK